MANELTKIPKFRRCVLQNFPFIEQDFDALTDYQLLCKVVEYLNKVIDSQNEVTSNLEQLNEEFITLKSYVDNYFENLDVQEEINNKIEQMVEDGSFQEILNSYVEPKLDELSEKIDTEVGTEKSARIEADNYLQNQIAGLASGSPLVASSTADMTDTSRVYVNTTDGKWYYYDGDSWEIGGTYQGTAVDESVENRIEVLEAECLDPAFNLGISGYVNASGVISTPSSDLYTRTDYIALDKYNKLTYNCYMGTSGCNVAFFDSNKDFIAADSITGETSQDVRTIDLPVGASFVIISNYHAPAQTVTPFAQLYKDDSIIRTLDSIVPVVTEDHAKTTLSYDNLFNKEFTCTISGSAVNAAGQIQSTGSGERTDYIDVEAYDKLTYTAFLNSSFNIVAFFDSSKTFISGVLGTGAVATGTVDVPQNAKYVILSNWPNSPTEPAGTLFINDSYKIKLDSLVNASSILRGKKVGFLGDSITNGYLATVPFRTIIAENTNCIAINYGINSSTLSNYGGGNNPVCDRYDDMADDLDYVCVLIGTNDTAPLGDSDSTDSATFNGALNNTIEGLITKYTAKKIMFMTLLPRRNSNLTAKNEAIKNRCKYYSIPCFDLFHYSNMNPNLDIVNTTLFANNDGLHPNNAGHAMLANKIQKWLESI